MFRQRFHKNSVKLRSPEAETQSRLFGLSLRPASLWKMELLSKITKVFEAEVVVFQLNRGVHLFRTKSKIDKMEDSSLAFTCSLFWLRSR